MMGAATEHLLPDRSREDPATRRRGSDAMHERERACYAVQLRVYRGNHNSRKGEDSGSAGGVAERGCVQEQMS